jgi:dnd system-associated protein 4
VKDRIRPPKDLEPVLDRLKEDGIIETKQKGMMLAAAIGYAIDRGGGRELDAAGEGIRLEYFERPVDDAYIDALAVAQSNDLRILENERLEERIDCFERYAHIGLSKMNEACYVNSREPLDALLALLDKLAKPRSSAALPGLEDVRRVSALL